LLLNAVIGTYQEWQAEQSSQALRKLLRMHAQVERDGEVREIKAEEVVPGDVLWLESGNRVPQIFGCFPRRDSRLMNRCSPENRWR
jgi:Ca2+-transporting ATPase